MSNEPQNNWKRRATKVGATALIAVGAAGCNNKPPSAEEVANVALEGAAQCQTADAPNTGLASKMGFWRNDKIRASVPCDMAGDKERIAADAAKAAERFAIAQQGDTTIYYGHGGAIFTYTTKAPSTETPPLMDTLSPRSAEAAEAPASGPHAKAVEVSKAASSSLVAFR